MIENVFILHHTHFDFGYTDERDKVLQKLVGMLDQVTDLVAASKGQPESAQFRWIHEVSWPVLKYLRSGGKRSRELFEDIRSGHVELTAIYVHPTDLFDRKSFEVSIDYACQLAREHNLPLKTAMFSDCPGIAWCLPDILASRGIRWLSAAPDLIMSMPLALQRPFWWEGPDGGRVLTWFTDWRHSWYGEGLDLKLHLDSAEGTQRLSAYIAELEREGYPWRGLAIHHAMDNQPPDPHLTDFVNHFNSVQSKVHARLATNSDFFEFMESAHEGEFETHRGAWPDWWANGNASAAYEVSCSRRAKASLERSAALSARLGVEQNPDRIRAAREDLLLFDEHSWGHSLSVYDPWSMQARLAWSQKRALVMRALYRALELEDDMAGRIGKDDLVVVANPFDTPWAGTICLPDSGKKHQSPRLRNTATGELIAGQKNPARFLSENSYQLSLAPGQILFLAPDGVTDAVSPFEALESPFFRIEYDPSTGAILDVLDKSLDRCLCDANAEWGFAELIHERVRRGGRIAMYDVSLGNTNPESKRPRPQFIRNAGHVRKRRCRLVTGPVYNALITRGCLPNVRFMREVRVYHGLPRIDVRLRLDKQVEIDYESLYMAFPFASGTRSAVWIENAGAVYRAGKDQLPGSATDWLSVGDYAAVENDACTTVLVPHHTPLVQVGEINTGKWARTLSVPNGHVYSWLMNNMWFTNFPVSQEGVVELCWSVASLPGTFDPVKAKRFAHSARVGVVVKAPQTKLSFSA